MRELTITEFENKFSKNGKLVKTQWIDLVKSLQQIGHVKLPNKEYGAAIVGGASKDGRHKKSSFSKIDVMIFDCDYVNISDIEKWLHENIPESSWLVYSTFSHQWYSGRFRVMIPAAKPIPADEYHSIWSGIDIPGKDVATKDISRLAFLPSTQNGNSGILRYNHILDNFHDFLEISSGQRNAKIAQLVGYWCNGKKVKKETLLKRALETNQTRCNPPLEENEITTIVDSIYDKELEARENGKTTYADKKDTKAKIAVDLALTQVKLFRGDGNEAIVKLENSYYLVESVVFESWLTKRYFEEYDDSIGRSSYLDAIHTLKSLALSKDEIIKVFRRVGYNKEKNILVYYLGDKNYVHISDSGWRVIRGDSCGLCFVHEANLQSYRNPVYDPNANLWILLRPFFNVNDTDFMLLLAWIIGSFWPYGPFPVLIGIGEQGSAKSTGSEFCAKVIDDRLPILIKPPKDSDNIYVSAFSRHVLAIDNLSFIDSALSDDLCRISTGAGFEKRKLYTDSETVSFRGSRPQILNSILSTIVGRGDLLDRAIIVNYLPIKKYKDLEKDFEAIIPYVHGAIFTVLVNVLRNLQNVPDSGTFSRMAAFEKRIKATQMPWVEHFSKVFVESRLRAEIDYVTGDEVYEAIIQFFNNSDNSVWEGLISDFVKQLNLRYDSKYKSAKALGRHLERLKPHLRKIGIDIHKRRISRGMSYQVRYKEVLL